VIATLKSYFLTAKHQQTSPFPLSLSSQLPNSNSREFARMATNVQLFGHQLKFADSSNFLKSMEVISR